MRPPSMITTTNNDGLPSLKVQNTTNNNNSNINGNIINNNQKLLSSESNGRIYSNPLNVEIINYKKYRTNHDNFINSITKTLSKNQNIISNPIADLNNRASSSSAETADVRLKRISSDINCYNLDTNNSSGSELLDSKNIKNKPLSDYTISTNINNNSNNNNNNNNNNIIVNKLSEVDGEKIPLLLFKSPTVTNSSTNHVTLSAAGAATTITTTTTPNKQESIVEFDLITKNLQNIVIHRNRDHSTTTRTNKKTTLRNNRRSLQLPIHATTDCNSNNNAEQTNYSKRRQQIHSWYAYGYETLFEELEQEKKKIQNQNMSRIPLIHAELEKLAEETSSESGASDDEYTVDFKDNIHYHNNLAGAKNSFTNGTRESASLLENNTSNLVHSSRNRRSNGGNYINTQQQHIQLEGPHAQSLGGPSQPARRKVGQFLKSLVSRKTTKDNLNSTPPLLPQNEQKEEKQQHQLPQQQSPANSLTNLTQTKRVGNSTTSLNIVNQKLWSVVPLFRRETSSSSLNQALKPNSPDHESSLRKCNTVLALTQTAASLSSEPIRPLNRLRNYTSIGTCSRCSSLLSVAAGSKYSLNISNGFVAVSDGETSPILESSSHEKLINITCKLCLGDVKLENLTKISQCGCSFCTECMTAYVEFEILEGAYEISCPDAMCPSQGILTIAEIMLLASNSLIEKHQRYRLNREIELDVSRTWCPKAGCETVCLVQTSSEKAVTLQPSSSHLQAPCAVHCPTCEDDFCSGCKKAWHPTMSCEENTRRLAADGHEDDAGIPFDGDLIKCCPMCAVPIEKDEGCAQMMCKRCKHVFCWYCLASLDDDFLLRHYDKGPCKNKLGHSRASVVWHRAQVIGIFAGFGILLLVASPLLLLAAPCIVCCKCRICSGATKLEENENEFDDVVALQR